MPTYKRHGNLPSVYLTPARIHELEIFLEDLLSPHEGEFDLDVSAEFDDTTLRENSFSEVLKKISTEDGFTPKSLTLVARDSRSFAGARKRVQVGITPWVAIFGGDYYSIEGEDRNWVFGAQDRIRRQMRRYINAWVITLCWLSLLMPGIILGTLLPFFLEFVSPNYGGSTLARVLYAFLLITGIYFIAFSPYGIRQQRPRRIWLEDPPRRHVDVTTVINLVAAVLTLTAAIVVLVNELNG